MDSELIRGAMLSHGMEPEMDDGMQGRFANLVVYGLGSLGFGSNRDGALYGWPSAQA
jgi:hypothetical protein